MSASARSPSAATVVAELQSRHATEVRSYAGELWPADPAGAEAAVAVFWREWMPPPGSAAEIPREYVFAGARRHLLAAQRQAGRDDEERESEDSAGEPKDPSARVAARFRRLTPKQQEVVRLHLRHRFAPDEIGVITELSAANAAQLLHTAIARLNGGTAEEARLVQLALAGTNGERVAAEAPENRVRLAELRVTIEVTRQVLSRGLETFRAEKPAVGRRRIRWISAAASVVICAALLAWWRSRGGGAADATGHTADSGGPTRVAIRQEAGVTRPASNGVSGDGAATTISSAPVRRSGLQQAQPTPVAAETGGKVRADAPGKEAGKVALEPQAAPEGIAAPESNPSEPSATQPAPAERSPGIAPDRHGPISVPQPRTTVSGDAPVADVVRDSRVESVRGRTQEERQKKPLADQIDTAPMAALRKALGASRWPERKEVHVGAMLNAFPPNSPPPAVDGPVVTTSVESGESPTDPSRRLVRVVLRAREDAPAVRAPATVILLLDVSGSMDTPNRLPLVQAAVGALLRRLRPEDRIGIVTYAGESRVLLPPSPLSAEQEIRAAVDTLVAKGRTNGGAGLREAFALVAADRRGHGEHVVLLCTDGDFNMGETTEQELGALIDRHRDSGVRLAIFGFGRADRIDARLEALAARARGGSGYVNTRAEAEQALVAQLDTLFAPVAEQLSATVEFDPAAVSAVRVAGEPEMQPVVRGRLMSVAVSERVLPGEEISALFEIEPTPGAALVPESEAWRVRVACAVPARDGQSPYYGLSSGGVAPGRFADASVDFRFAAAVAAFGEALQAGPDEGAARLDEIEGWAQAALGEDAGGYRAEFLAMIGQARRAAGKNR